MGRVFNFSAGPAVLPESVLREAADEMLDYHGCGMSVMEMSHRSSTFGEIIKEAESDLRELMGIPSNYKVLFLQGGGSTQFAMVPMNLMRGGHADYVVSGSWSKKAFQEAARFGGPRVIGDSSDKNFSYVPKRVESSINPSADYVYICQNETIYGTKYYELPETGEIPLVSDISSCFMPVRKKTLVPQVLLSWLFAKTLFLPRICRAFLQCCNTRRTPMRKASTTLPLVIRFISVARFSNGLKLKGACRVCAMPISLKRACFTTRLTAAICFTEPPAKTIALS